MIEQKVKNGMQNEVSKNNIEIFIFPNCTEEITVKNCLIFLM